MTKLYDVLDQFLAETEITFFNKKLEAGQDKTLWSTGVVVYTAALALIPDLREQLTRIIPGAEKAQVLVEGSEFGGGEAYYVPAIKIQKNLETDFNEKDLKRALGELNQIFNRRLENARIFSEQVDKIEDFESTILGGSSSEPYITIRCQKVPFIDASFLPNNPNSHHSIDDDPIFQNEVTQKIISLFKKYGVEVDEEQAKLLIKYTGSQTFKIPPHAFDSAKFAENGNPFQKELNDILRKTSKEASIAILEREYGNSGEQVPPEIRKNLELEHYAIKVFGESISEYPSLRYEPDRTDLSNSHFRISLHSKDVEQIEAYLESSKSLPTILRKNRLDIDSNKSFDLIIMGGLLDKLELKNIDSTNVKLEIPVRLVEALQNLEPDAEKLVEKIKKAKVLEQPVVRTK